MDTYLAGDGWPVTAMDLLDCDVLVYLNEAGVLEVLVAGEYGSVEVTL